MNAYSLGPGMANRRLDAKKGPPMRAFFMEMGKAYCTMSGQRKVPSLLIPFTK